MFPSHDQVVTDSPRHVHCRCHKMVKPQGYVWDEEKGEFMPPKESQRKVERKSKVKIEFGGKTYEA